MSRHICLIKQFWYHIMYRHNNRSIRKPMKFRRFPRIMDYIKFVKLYVKELIKILNRNPQPYTPFCN